MQSDQPPLPPVILPSRRRLMMQQLERHADQFSDHDHAQEAANESLVDKDHSLQQEPADEYDHEIKLKNGSSLRAKYGLSIQNDIAPYEEDDDDVDNDSQAGVTDFIDNRKHIRQLESAAVAHYQKRGSANESALRIKYGLPNHTSLAANYTEDDYNEYEACHPDDSHLLQREVNPRVAPSAYVQGAAGRSDRAKNSHHQDNHTGPRITPSTLEAAQAQAAELRALHSAMLSNYGFVNRNGATYRVGHPSNQKQDAEDAIIRKSRPKKAISKKKSKVYIHEDHQMQEELDINPPSSSSSVSSTADCFIRPAHEYPIFMPAHAEDMLRSTMDGLNSMNRRSSVDSSEVLLREERLNYIFDHDNKSTFSGRQYDGHSVRDNNISCLHESLNLPRRSASSLLHMHDKDDGQLLHHMSLNLPQGSQHHLFNAAKYCKQSPLCDHFDSSNAEQKRAANLTSSDSASIQARHNDDSLHAVGLRNKSAQADPYELEAGLSITGRQRALLEFLSEEPGRIRAFNELAAKETPDQSAQKVLQMQRIHQKNAAVLANCDLSSSRRIKGKHESIQGVDHLQGSSDPRLKHPIIHDPSISRVRQKLTAHTLNNIDHHDQNTNLAPGVSCDKCRPLVGAHSTVSPLPDSKAYIGTVDHPPPNPTNSAAASKEKAGQKKPASIKGWFFRGKKKQNAINADVSGVEATTASTAAAGKVRSNAMMRGASSAPKDVQSTSSTTSTAAATSQVFSSLINTEAERELEMAMAMDLMELKVLQAKTKRDAAMAEVLELRLAMDSMAKKLVEVERHCVDLKTQLKDAQAMQRQNHKDYASAAAGIVNASNQVAADTLDDIGSAEASVTDNCDSDSNDHREERRPAKGISVVRAGLSSGCMQPSKAEFLNAVAEARVGVKQVGRALLQHIQESKGERAFLQAQPEHKNADPIAAENQLVGGTVAGMASDRVGLMTEKGMDRDNWGPIMMMCREAARREKAGMNGTSYVNNGRGRTLGYYVEALISMVFHEHFENVGFDKNGTHKILDPSQRALTFYQSFLKLAKLTPTQLLTHSSPLYNSAFDRFCSRKMRCLARAVGCPARLWPDELATTFLAAARALWLLHHLAYAYQIRPPGIFRVAAPSTFDTRFMEALPTDHCHVPPSHCLVSVLVMPGFFLPDDIIKCKVLAT